MLSAWGMERNTKHVTYGASYIATYRPPLDLTFGHGGQAVRGAQGVGHGVHVGGVLVLVDSHHEHAPGACPEGALIITSYTWGKRGGAQRKRVEREKRQEPRLGRPRLGQRPNILAVRE